MQPLATFLTVVGGLLFSIAIAVYVEEWIFCQIFRTFFSEPHAPLEPPRVLTNWMVQPVRVRGNAPR